MTYDVIVAGLGAMGSAAMYQLSKTGKKILGIDQFTPPHVFGSTHGDTRITRQAIGEGEQYVPLVLRAYEIWDEIEKLTNKKVLFKVGGLIMATSSGNSEHHGVNAFLRTTIDTAQKFDIKHELLETQDIAKRFPQFNITNEKGYFEYDAGYLTPELCVELQLELAKAQGAEIHVQEKIISWNVEPSGKVIVKTDKGQYETEKLILSAGPWIGEYLPQEYSEIFKVYRQVLYWFNITENDFPLFDQKNMPVYIWEFGGGFDDFIYGFPAIDGPTGGVKVASEQYQTVSDPDSVQREVSEDEIQSMYQQYIQQHMSKLLPKVVKAASCLYTVTKDSHFVIDFHPQYEQVIIASPCSGHGFKHSAAIGEVLSQLALTGKSEIDISGFEIDRLVK